MINYSIVKRSVNANLIEINQAKSRINQAKKEGKTPQPADLALVKTEKQNAFAVAQYTGVMNIDKFSRHISSHGSVYSRADIAAILYLTVDCMREQLLEGKKIRLGDLGDFSVSLSSKGVEDPNAFNAQNITGVKVIWEPGAEFKSLVTTQSSTSLHHVTHRQPSSRPSSRARTTSTSASLLLLLLAALPKAAALRLAAAPTIPRVAAIRPKAAVLVTENNF